MTDNFGCVVALIPQPGVIESEVEGGAHITLAFFGNEAVSEIVYEELLDVAYEVSEKFAAPVEAKFDGYDSFGSDGDAYVARVQPYPIEQIRHEFLSLMSPTLQAIFSEAETFPDYKPHITLGYLSDGYVPREEIDLDLIPLFRIEVWNGGDREGFEFTEGIIKHYGTPRKSGRYPWGSGENPTQRNRSFLDSVSEMRKQGMTQTEIARGMGITTKQLRAAITIAGHEQRQIREREALKLKEKGWSTTAIAKHMGVNESSVRSLLDPVSSERQKILMNTSNLLKDQLKEKGYLDIGEGNEARLSISSTKLSNAVAVLQQEGYEVYKLKIPQLGTKNETTIKVLAPPGTTFAEVAKNQHKIGMLAGYSEDGGRTFLGIEPPQSVKSKRIAVRYAEEGGTDKDGVIELRRGVEDISLGASRYAQVRISVDGTHYLKGMAMYADDLPDGVDIRFNTNKSKTGNKLDAMKPLKDDEDNPFGATIRQKHYLDASGKKKLSPLNIVGSEKPDGTSISGEEGSWHEWSKSLSSQMLSKQSRALAKAQLGKAFDIKKAEFDEIMELTDPAVKKKLLQSFADDADASAVHLKAASLPRTRSHVILPINSLKDNEIYAPNYKNGETVVLIRHPHGGIFEIPELIVNNRNRQANSLIKNAKDAVGINSKVAGRLSGADFDGDTVLVIPNNQGKIKTRPPLAGLKNFDPQIYKNPDGVKPMSSRAKQQQMGDVSNLITDMHVKGATMDEIARAVRHSMVVIDAEKHNLNYKQSSLDNGIKELKQKYQQKPDGTYGGASTLISKAKSEQRVNERKPRSAANGGPIDKATGKKVYEETGASYVNAKGQTVRKTTSSTKMAEVSDAHKLSSGHPMEAVYADHANRLKSLANTARKEREFTKSSSYSPTSAKTYAKEVSSLRAKLNEALKAKPLERQAQLIANNTLRQKKAANPEMTKEEVKKVKFQALAAARVRTGAKKNPVNITPREWEAIRSGAISTSLLNKILDNTDIDVIKGYATPKVPTGLSAARLGRARAMMAAGYTAAEVAESLGVSTSTLYNVLG